MSLRNKDFDTTLTPDPMKRLNNITDNRVLRKRKRKSNTEATQSDQLEGKNQIHLKIKVCVYRPMLEKLMQKVVRDLLIWKQ